MKSRISPSCCLWLKMGAKMQSPGRDNQGSFLPGLLRLTPPTDSPGSPQGGLCLMPDDNPSRLAQKLRGFLACGIFSSLMETVPVKPGLVSHPRCPRGLTQPGTSALELSQTRNPPAFYLLL